MQQRQLRPGDTLDDYCPRERRLTNHVVVAMIGDDVKQTRCTTCDADHEYKHARVPRQRKKSEAPAILSPVASAAPKRVAHDSPDAETITSEVPPDEALTVSSQVDDDQSPEEPMDVEAEQEPDEDNRQPAADEGPVHRPLIRAQLPRIEGQPPTPRQTPDFTIRQPAGRTNRFRPRHQRGGQSFQSNRSNGNMGNARGGQPRQFGGKPPLMPQPSRRQGSGGRKRSK